MKYEVNVGGVVIGGNQPVVIQSMTDTTTANVHSTAEQIKMLAKAGSEIVRITVNDEKAAAAVPEICKILKDQGFNVPIVGCFHYNGHELLRKFPKCAENLAKFRINPGNVGFGRNKDRNFEEIIKIAVEFDKPVRIGVNWGSLDQALLAQLMDENSKLSSPLNSDEILQKALVESSLQSAKKAESLGLAPNKIIISCKVSKVQALISTYRELNAKCSYPLHLGLTEAGMGDKGMVATTAALAILLQENIGNTIRCSLTPEPGSSRTKEVEICQLILQSLGKRSFAPEITACPGCGRTSSDFFRKLAAEIQNFIKKQMPIWKIEYPGVEKINIAVMGCIVNGPGESKHADIGISLPGDGENPSAPVFVDGKKIATLKGDKIAQEFKQMLLDYVKNRFST